MLKFIGVLILVFSGLAIGNCAAEKLKKKLIFLESFKDFIAYVKSEIKYSLSSPEKIINNYSSNNVFQEYIKKCQSLMKHQRFNFSQSWETTLDSDFSNIFDDSEKIIRKFGVELGSADIESQIALCDLTSERLLFCIESTTKELNDKRKIFLTVGVCSGAALSVLLF